MYKAILKRFADMLEKVAVGALIVGVFQGNQLGMVLSCLCILFSVIFTIWETKK